MRDYLAFFLVFLLSITILIGVLSNSPQAPQISNGYTQKVWVFFYHSITFLVGLVGAFWATKVCLRCGWVNADLVYQGYLAPINDFFKRYGALAIWVLLLVGFYRISDIVLGVITNIFYADMGYSKAQIASVSKVFGVAMTIFGSFMGGLLVLKLGVMRVLMLGAVLVSVINLLFMWLAQIEPNIIYLSLVICVDNLSQGISLAAFVAWLSSLTNVTFTATQYAIFSSLMTLLPKLIGGYSGTMVESIGYENFFLFASLLGVPVIVLIYFLQSRLIVSHGSTSR